jgi:hypothetical protein
MDIKDQATITGISPVINSTTSHFARRGIGSIRTTLGACMLVLTAVLSACSSATSAITPVSTVPPASVQQNTAAPIQATIPPATPVPQNTATPIPATNVPGQATIKSQLDPCQLISSQEASTLAGASFGSGKEGTTPGGLNSCTYGSQGTNVFTVDVVQAPDVNAAKADKAQFLADLQASLQQLTDQGLNVTQEPNFADGAVLANASVNGGGITMNGSAIGFLKGTIFFGFSDIVLGGGAAPNSTALHSEATTVIGRLP